MGLVRQTNGWIGLDPVKPVAEKDAVRPKSRLDDS